MSLRRANGSGSVFKVKGKRRKPWRVRVTVGYEFSYENGRAKQITKDLGYYLTRAEADAALVAYLDNPFDLNIKAITFSEVYEMWFEEYSKGLDSVSSERTITSAYAYMSSLYNKKIRDLRVVDLENCIKNAKKIETRGSKKGEVKMASPDTKSRMKSVFNLLFDYANARDMVVKNYARAFELSKDITEEREKNKKKIEIFNNQEIQLLWDNVNKIQFVDMVLIGLYTGWRPQELATLKVANVNVLLDDIVGGLKTEAGRNRRVPIHPLVKELVVARYNEAKEMGSDYLFNDPEGQQGTFMTYDKYRRRFQKIMERLGMEHRPHETRHTFVTNCVRSGVDRIILKRIIGHKINDITEDTYTHRVLQEFKRELGKLGKFLPDGSEIYTDVQLEDKD